MTGIVPFTKFDSDVAIKYSQTASDVLGSDYYYTVDQFVYYIEDYPSNKHVRVPAGFLSDGASIPRAFWFWASPIGRHAQAAILHDFLCEYLTIMVDGVPTSISRKEADLIFKESLLVLGVSKFRANVMYGAVSAYRILANVTAPSFSIEKQRLELEIQARLKAGKTLNDGSGILYINTRKRVL